MKTKQKKENKYSVKYYINLPYRVVIDKIPKDKGGGFCATIPELGQFAFLGVGETEAEAIKNLRDNQFYLFTDYLKENIKIPMPKPIPQQIVYEHSNSSRFIFEYDNNDWENFLAIQGIAYGFHLEPFQLMIIEKSNLVTQQQLKFMEFLFQCREDISDEISNDFLRFQPKKDNKKLAKMIEEERAKLFGKCRKSKRKIPNKSKKILK